MEQVLNVLKSSDVEPSIRRSALNQISVMMDDILLHSVFLNSNGLELVITIIESALTEKIYTDYPDAVIPIISILKNLCLHQANVRDELSNDNELLYWILRALFMFFTEEQMKQDASMLLFFLIFKDFIQGNPSRADISLPLVVCETMRTPFQCASHWMISPNTNESLKGKRWCTTGIRHQPLKFVSSFIIFVVLGVIVNDRWCMSSIQIQWNCELFGGFQELVQKNEIDYNRIDCSDILKLTQYDLLRVKTSSVHYCVKYHLNQLENSTTHISAVDSIDFLTL